MKMIQTNTLQTVIRTGQNINKNNRLIKSMNVLTDKVNSYEVDNVIGVATVIGAAQKIVGLFKGKGKSARSDFFTARNQVSDEIFKYFASKLGYSFKNMQDYYWKNSGKNNATANERKIVNDWWTELNALNIGDNAASARALEVKDISLKSFDFAMDALTTAVKNFASKYMPDSDLSNGAERIPVFNTPIYTPQQTPQKTPQTPQDKLNALTSTTGISITPTMLIGLAVIIGAMLFIKKSA